MLTLTRFRWGMRLVAKSPSLRERVYRRLIAEGRALTLPEIAGRLEEDIQRVSDALRHLRGRGLVSLAHSYWRPIQPATPPTFAAASRNWTTRPPKKDPEEVWSTQADREWLAYWRLPRAERLSSPRPKLES